MMRRTACTLFASSLPALIAGCTASGPAVREWEETGGPYAQNISAVLPDNRIPGTVYASLGNGEIAVTTSDGRSWGRGEQIPGGPEVRQLVQDPDSPDRLFAATDAGAFLSPDRARSWDPLHVGPAGTGVRAIAIDPWSPAVLYAGTEGKGLFKSPDSGKTWMEINTSADLNLAGSDVYDIGIDLSKPDRIFAAVSPYGILGSTNGGRTWEALTPDMPGTGPRATRLLVGRAGMILFGTTSGSIVKSTNGGISWTPSRAGKEFDGILSFSTIPGNPDGVIAGTEQGIIYSSDFGSRWEPSGGSLPELPTRVSIAGAGSKGTIFAYGSGIGMRASGDSGKTWRDADLKLEGSSVSVLASDPSGTHLFAASGDVCMRYSADPAGLWSGAGPGITGGPIRSISIDPSLPAVVYATTAGGAFISRDNAATWQPASRSVEISPFLYEAHPSIGTRVFMAGDQGIFVSTDQGRTWLQSRPLGTRWIVHSLTFSPTNAGRIIGTSPTSAVIISNDGGFTWEQARYGIPGDRVEAVTLDDADPDVYYAYLPDGECFRSLNRGLEWNRYNPPWKQSENIRISPDPHVPSSVVALVDGRHVYYSPSGGGTWFKLFDADLHARAVSLCWNSATMTLYAGAGGRGVFRLPLGERIREILGE
jgi:photosystem II stability/assembly factor-like uncharacterized protein